jgi:hypothetical protein
MRVTIYLIIGSDTRSEKHSTDAFNLYIRDIAPK